jgi:antitoxin ParD1/3/4
MEARCLGYQYLLRSAMSTKNTSIALGAPFVEFASRKVASGEFGSTSEVVREAMRRYIAEEEAIVALRQIIQEGLDSGSAVDFDIDAWFEEEFGSE